MANTSAIFKGSRALLLPATGIEFKAGTYCDVVNIDPSLTAYNAAAGSVIFSTLTKKIYIKQDDGSSTNWEILTTATDGHSAGVLYPPPSITDNGNGTVSLGACDCALHSDANHTTALKKYTIPAQNDVSLTDNATNYICALNIAGDVAYFVTTDVSFINESDCIPVFTIYRGGNNLHFVPWDSLGSGLANKIHQSIVKTERFRRESGLSLSESATRVVNIGAGAVWIGANKIDVSATNSTTGTMALYAHVAGVWTRSNITQYNNTQYDNGTNLVTLTANRYAVNFVFRGIEQQNHIYVVLGQGDYTLAQAQSAQVPGDLPQAITSHAMLVGRIIVQKDASTATEVDSAFVTNFTQGALTQHNDSGGLQGGSAAEYYHLNQDEYDTFRRTRGENFCLAWNMEKYAVGATTGDWTVSNATATVTSTAGEVLFGTRSLKLNSSYDGGTVQLLSKTISPGLVGQGVTFCLTTKGLSSYAPTVDSTEWQIFIRKVSGSNQGQLAYTKKSVPAGTYKATHTFIPDEAADYVIEAYHKGASNQTIVIDNCELLEKTTVLAPTGTDWQKYVPIETNKGTAQYSGDWFYRIDGDTVEIKALLITTQTSATAGPYSFSMPAGMVLDGAKGNVSGSWSVTDTGDILKGQEGTLRLLSGGNMIGVQIPGGYAGVNALFPSIAAGQNAVCVHAIAPVQGYSSNVQVIDGALEEYAFNYGADPGIGGVETSSFGYGPQGTNFLAFNSTSTGSTKMRCQFKTRIAPTDVITLEGSINGEDWVSIPSGFCSAALYQGTSQYGAYITIVTDTTVEVVFSGKGRLSNNATYGGNGAAWGDITSYKWRVRKVSQGSLVGVGPLTTELVKHTDGTFLNNTLNALPSTYAPIAKGVTNGDGHDHNGGDGAQIAHSSLSGIGVFSHSQIDTFMNSKGVTNGDGHDHSGGDGGQINHTSLSNIGSYSHAQIDSHINDAGLHQLRTKTFDLTWPVNRTYVDVLHELPGNAVVYSVCGSVDFSAAYNMVPGGPYLVPNAVGQTYFIITYSTTTIAVGARDSAGAAKNMGNYTYGVKLTVTYRLV